MKIKILTIMLFIALFSSFASVSAETLSSEYELITYDNEGYNLMTGAVIDDINMSRTNKVTLLLNSVDNKLYFNNSDFNHILFFNSSNIYLGYGNGNGSILEYDTFLSYVMPDGDDFSIDIPESARKFALLNYDYNDTILLTGGNLFTAVSSWTQPSSSETFGNGLASSYQWADSGDYTLGNLIEVEAGATYTISNEVWSLGGYTLTTNLAVRLYDSSMVNLGNIGANAGWSYGNNVYQGTQTDSPPYGGEFDTTELIDEMTIPEGVSYIRVGVISIVNTPSFKNFSVTREAPDDPLGDYYPSYYPLGNFLVLDIFTLYDSTPGASDRDFRTSFNESIESIGIDTPQEQLFGAFLIMAMLAIILGLRYKSVAIVMISEVLMVFIFTVLGWFSIWFILVTAIIFVLLIILNSLKGGA